MTMVALGDIAELRAGVGFPPRLQGRQSGDYPMAKVGDISRVGRSSSDVLVTATNYVDAADLSVLKMKPVPAGSVLFAKIGEAIRQNHRVVAGCPVLIDNNAMAAVPHANAVDQRYFFRTMQTLDLYALASSTTVPSLRKSDLQRVHVPLPPLPEQRRIAAILDHADALRAKRRQVLAHLDSLTQSIFHAMFGNPTTGGRWQVRRVDEIASPTKHSIVDGPFGSALKPHDYVSSGVPIIRIKNISSDGELNPVDLKYIRQDKFEALSRSALLPGDVLVSRVGTLGNTCVFPQGFGDALLSTTGVCKVTVDTSRFDPVFVHRAFRTRPFQRQIERSASTSVQKYFNLSALKGWHIVEPPLELQHRFAERARRVNEQRSAIQRALAADDELFASLQSRAFAGEL